MALIFICEHIMLLLNVQDVGIGRVRSLNIDTATQPISAIINKQQVRAELAFSDTFIMTSDINIY